MTRGRPRKTDVDTVLDTAMKLFWENGYEATSMNDVAAKTGMAKPGLYATFGNKDALYEKALARYFSRSDQIVANLASSTAPIAQSVREFLDTIAHSVTSADAPCGCFLTNTLVETAGKPSDIAALGRQLNENRNAAFTQRFRRAATDAELAPDADPDALAAYFSAQSLALAVLASSGASYGALQSIIDTAMTVLPGQAA